MRNQQQDILKGIAIILVIVSHLFARFFSASFNLFIFYQAVPIFLLFIGFNGFNSLERNSNIKIYYQKALKRIFIPFLIFAFVAFVFDIIINKLPLLVSDLYPLVFVFINNLITGHYTLLAPGYYFMTLVFQLIILLPIIHYSYKRFPKSTLISFIIFNFLFEVYAITAGEYFINSWYNSAFRYLFLIGIGIWLAEDYKFNKRNLFIPITAVLSIVYLILFLIYGNSFFVLGGAYIFLAAAYPGLIVMLGLNFLPNKNNILAWFGRHCYIIFLIQMLLFGIWINLT